MATANANNVIVSAEIVAEKETCLVILCRIKSVSIIAIAASYERSIAMQHFI